MTSKPSKIKKYTAIAVLIILVGCLAVLALFLVRSYRRSARFENALTALEAQDRIKAKGLFLQVLATDPNNEIANLKLAEIFTGERFYPAAAYYYNQSSRLNPLNLDYRQKYYDSLLLSRDFERLNSIFDAELKMRNPVTAHNMLLYILSSIRTGKIADGRKAYDKLAKENPAALKEDLGILLDFLVKSDKLTSEAISARLIKMGQSSNVAVAYEAYSMLYLHYLATASTDKNIENAARNAAKANPAYGNPVLVEYLVRSYRFNDAIKLLEEYLDTYPDLQMSLTLGELYFYTDQGEKLAKLQEKFNSGNKAKLLLGYYLQSLQYALKNNIKALSETFENVENAFRSPLVALLALHVHLYRGNADAVEKDAIHFNNNQVEFLNVNEKARRLLLSELKRLVEVNDSVRALKLARLLNSTQKPDLLIARLLNADRLASGTLDESEIEQALKDFPNDPFLLRIGAENALNTNRPTQAIKYLDQFNKSYPKVNDHRINELSLFALERAGELDKATKEYRRQMLLSQDDVRLMGAFFEFAYRNRLNAELKELYTLASKSSDPAIREFMPFITAEQMLLDNREEPALEVLSTAMSSNPGLKFRAAYVLGSHDRFAPAIRFYEELLTLGINQHFMLINLAELLNASGDKTKAAEYAVLAYELAPREKNVQLCLARILTSAGMTDKLVAMLKMPQLNANTSPELLSLWRPAAEQAVQKAFQEHRYMEARNLTDKLLSLFPGNAVALRYDEQLKRAMKK